MKNHNSGLENLITLFEQTQSELQNRAARSVDIALVVRNWLFGWYIVEYEQYGGGRSEYGTQLIKRLSERLTIKGCSERSLALYCKFYKSYSEILQTVSAKFEVPYQELQNGIRKVEQEVYSPAMFAESNMVQALSAQFTLSWSHYVILMTIDNMEERRFYEIESGANSWSIRELKRLVESSLYERLALSRDKAKVKELSKKGLIIGSADDVIKSPYVLEFLNLPEKHVYSEYELETAIIDKLEHFLLELGKGFLFEARQKRFTFDDDHFYVDLVFYNRLLCCYVLIDLKRDKLTHQDLGQMQMYLNYFDRYVKIDDEAPTIGIVLCHRKHDALVELILPKDSNVYASKYQLYLPSKEELKRQVEESLREQGEIE